MGALAPSPHWAPEDDLLLKNAIEAGASLESLARGAVQFSKRFTKLELQERWHSLLYDPKISAESCALMNELERSTPNLPPKFNFSKMGSSKETKNLPAKRKIQTVRACYHELHKKKRIDPFSNVEELDFLAGSNDADYLGNVAEPLFRNGVLDDPLLTDFVLDPSHLDIIHNAFPGFLAENPIEDGSNIRIHNPVEDNPYRENMTNEVLHNDNAFTGISEQMIISSNGDLGYRSSDFEDNHFFNSQFPEYGPSLTLQTMECTSQIPTTAERLSVVVSASALNEEAHRNSKISGTLRYEPKTELLPPSESVAPVGSAGTYLAELSNTLLNDEDCMDLDGKELADRSFLDGLNSLLANSPTGGVVQEIMENATDITAETSVAPNNLNGGVSVGNNRISSTDAPAYDPHPEIVNEVICCVLNTEDPEIPCNDHVFDLSSGWPSSSTSWAQKNFKPCSSTPSSIRNFRAKIASNARTSRLSRETFRPQGDMKTPQTSLVEESDAALRCGQNVTLISKGTNPEIEQRNTEAEVNVQTEMLEPEEDLVESDDELPCFSDVEAMILDKDLDPDDQDLFELEVAKYQCEDSERAIIRLEQSARSCMRRELASRGAFAVLYGRDSKHFIKKQEVLLGRSTGEYRIDIDLGRGGSKTHISRRQAVISLDNDGTFHIKNLGKRPIGITDKELDPGKSSNLVSNSLIEIRGMWFMFEFSEKLVKRFLDGRKKEQSCQKPGQASS